MPPGSVRGPDLLDALDKLPGRLCCALFVSSEPEGPRGNFDLGFGRDE